MPKIKIKAKSIANLTDARYFAAMGVDYLSFLLDLSHDERIDPAIFHGIKAWVEGPQIVAQVGKTPPDLLYEIYDTKDFDLVCCHFECTDYDKPDTIYTLTPPSLQALAHETFDVARIYHLDLRQIPEDDLYTSKLLSELCAKHQLFISAPTHEDYIRQLIQDVKPYGIELMGGDEEKVGFKSYEELDVFFDQFEIYA